jgi:hypothetical protein
MSDESINELSKRHDNLANEVNALVKRAEAAERAAKRTQAKVEPGTAVVERSKVRAVALVATVVAVLGAVIGALVLLLSYGVL